MYRMNDEKKNEMCLCAVMPMCGENTQADIYMSANKKVVCFHVLLCTKMCESYVHYNIK